MGRFDGRVALVTGAGGAIGAATARLLSSEGAAVACADLRLGPAEETAASLGGDHAASAVAVDVADAESCREAVAHAVEVHGRLDVLAHIAGVSAFGHSEDLAPARWERTIAVNLNGTFFMDQAALPPLLATGGAIVNMASAAGLRAVGYHAAYNTSKAGVVMLTRSLAVEFAARGVRICCVCPGAVDTPFLAAVGEDIPADADLGLLGRGAAPSGQVATAGQVAAAIAYLASDDAGGVTGVALPIDGGATA
jgi:NAD(P)-dependent dehydrogenase (short-subunit alcohol dehydrogenase family)